ncbi:MAG: aminotransferase class I/II-fold pyridoxal phosphate-dependent enzyme [Anaerolineae bacterium]|nr:aminotransferase class I/II-fold pyridoxal phosphate-dependent enzyme [Anaerolineae bacterium]
MDFKMLDPNALKKLKTELTEHYQGFQSQNLVIDMTRGKPCPEQLDLSSGLLTCVDGKNFRTADGDDCRNYGGLDGIPEAKTLFADFLEVEPDEIVIGGNASLTMMHDTILRAMVKGLVDSDVPWVKLSAVKFLCPCPGYDRHFSICQYLGIEMIPVEMQADGPDMDTVEEIVAQDETVKGIWCVPKYSNPTGVTYSDDVVERLARMKTAAQDFRIFYDNAYTVHHLTDTPDRLRNILTACKQAGNPDRVFIFGSTSKVSFAGGGVAMMAGSKKNIEFVKQQLFFQTIGPDKLNQLRHVCFFKDMAGIEAHMKKHAAILKPKFDAVQDILERELAGKNVATWSRPNGGYFISFDTMDGCAQAVIKLAGEAGVKFTPAGATFPYKKDPRDRNIRLAPTFPPIEDIRLAIEVLATCTQLVSIDKLAAKK